jgi:hypothetical protein
VNKIIIFAIVVFVSTSAFAERVPNQLGLDWRTERPTGKNWIKVTDVQHYLDKSSVKKIKGTIYQASLCNELKLPSGGKVWNYFKVRVDCKSKQAYTQSQGKWIGPMEPTNYDNAVLIHACK